MKTKNASHNPKYYKCSNCEKCDWNADPHRPGCLYGGPYDGVQEIDHTKVDVELYAEDRYQKTHPKTGAVILDNIAYDRLLSSLKGSYK